MTRQPLTIYGINPVLEALRAGLVREVRIAHRSDDRFRQILDLAQTNGVSVRRVHADVLERESGRGVHQGVVADVEEADEYSVEDLVRRASGPPLIVVLDSIEDPHNLGAILRTAEAAGVDGVVIQSRRAAARSGIVAKASAGALAHVKIAEVVNIARAIDDLKAAGVWTVGLAGDTETRYDAVDFTVPTAFVLGAEGAGLRRLVREHCDRLVSIPMRGAVGSLNVSVAAGVALFEAIRQRGASVRPGNRRKDAT